VPLTLQHAGRRALFDPSTLWLSASTDHAPPHHSGSGCRPLTTVADTRELTADRRQLERLVLNVANLCNLDCGYCYAQGGDYGGPRERMGSVTGRTALRRFMTEYDEVATVQFFGGEPLLNAPLIRELCDFGRRMADELDRPEPTWMLSTNGTVCSDEILRLIADYEIKVTVSCDGPPHIHDTLRPMRSGEPSSPRLRETVLRMMDATGQPVQAEGTLTALHVSEGVSVLEAVDWIHDELGIDVVHMPVNVLDADGPHDRTDPHGVDASAMSTVAEWYARACERAVKNIACCPLGTYGILSTALELLEQLVRPGEREHPVICPAGTGTIAVDVDGTVYPCFMFYRRAPFRFGHVAGSDAVGADAQQAFTAGLSRERLPEAARTSFARRFIAGCAGGNYFRGGDHAASSADGVQLVEAMVAATVVTLAHLDGGDRRFVPLGVDLLRRWLGAPVLA